MAWFVAMAGSVICTAGAATTPNFDLGTLETLLKHAPSTGGTVRFDDMLFRKKDLVELKRRLESRKQPRAAVQTDLTTWTGGRVPYVFDANVSAFRQQQFLAACEEWASVVKVNFVPRTTEENYVLVQASNENTSYVGMVGGVQELHMLNWDEKFIICHELGHALGLSHEQCRSDRDLFITIHTENIEDGFAYAFRQLETTNATPYDFGSVMQYGMYAFSKNSQPTIVPKPGYESSGARMGQRTELSFYDKKAVASLYGAQTGLAVETFVLRDPVTTGLTNNGNGRVNAGEHVVMIVTVRNSTTAASSAVTASLLQYSNFLTFSKTTATVPKILAGQTADLSFPFTVARSAKLEPEFPVDLHLSSSFGTSDDTLLLPGLPPGSAPTLAPERIRVKKIKKIARLVEGTLSFVCKDPGAESFQIEYAGRMNANPWSALWKAVRTLKRRDGVVNYSVKIRVKTADQLQFRVRAVNAYGNKVSKIITVRH
jgi:hypothetical protein